MYRNFNYRRKLQYSRVSRLEYFSKKLEQTFRYYTNDLYDVICLSCILSFFIVDCQWDEWMEGQCSKTCGGGTQIDTRYKKIKAAYGGEECAGPSNATKECNTQECPGW